MTIGISFHCQNSVWYWPVFCILYYGTFGLSIIF